MLIRLDGQSKPYANHDRFGVVGAIEELAGTAHFAVDPRHPRNARAGDKFDALSKLSGILPE
ncbi:MAG TPA: hypothetical protein VGL99_14350 [Chloroflexota bacterium]|jgi:hypothetical protein